MIEGSGSIPLTNGSGSGSRRPKNMWIRNFQCKNLCFPVLKTGASGMIAYRLQCKDLSFQYLQTSSRLVYKNSKPDFIISTHRPLT